MHVSLIMTDFTKEELQLILVELERALFSRYYAEDMPELRKKIQSMVETYCNHEWKESPRLDWLYYCMKCRKERCKRCAKETILTDRLQGLEHFAQQGVIPGQLDTMELEQLIGRIKELKLVIKLLAADSIAAAIMEHYNDID